MSSQIRGILSSLKNSNNTLDDLAKFGIEITEEKGDMVRITPDSVDNVSLSEGTHTMLIRDVIDDNRPTSFPVMQDIINLSMDSDKFFIVFAEWRKEHKEAKLLSMNLVPGNIDKTIIKYTLR